MRELCNSLPELCNASRQEKSDFYIRNAPAVEVFKSKFNGDVENRHNAFGNFGNNLKK
jgi:hypothetical protein